VNQRAKQTRFAGFAIVILTIAIAAGGFLVVRKDIEAMRRAGNETILWSALQVEIELMRFGHALAEFRSGDGVVTPKDVNARFDILWSRVSIFRQGTVGARLSAYDARQATVALLFAKIKEVEPLVTGLKPGDRATARLVQDQLAPFADDLRVLSRKVLHGEEAKTADLREDLSRSSGVLATLSAIAVLASLLLIFVFARETGRFRQLAAENLKLLEISRGANKAKAQFLAMMSHELRTPMNGVLGLLALVRQHGLSGHQNRLMDRAEQSGTQMIGLLRDILDFSALQENQLKLDSKPFEIHRLTDAVRDMFEPVALREGIEFKARVDPGCPERLIGDFARLRQALAHLCTYVLETAGARNIALDIGHDGNNLTASISFEYSQVGGEWEPDLIMGTQGQSPDGFASEALGPAVARGLIDRMGGATKLYNPTDDRIAVLVTVPAKPLVLEALLILVVTQSTALEAICKASLRAENVRFLSRDCDLAPHVVMIEAGGEKEAQTVRSCGERYPHAILVALGKPLDPDLFEDVLDVPIDIANIRRANFMRLAFSATKLAEDENLRYAENRNAT